MTNHSEHLGPGVARIILANGQRLTYRSEPRGHRVIVTDEFERVVLTFGGRGKGLGRFNLPLDLTFVRPEFTGECLPAVGPDADWLAIADYGNRRVQIFELDGGFVGAVDAGEWGTGDPPCGLHWRAPVLEIVGVEGACSRIHLSAALLCAGAKVHLTRPPREWLPTRAWVN